MASPVSHQSQSCRSARRRRPDRGLLVRTLVARFAAQDSNVDSWASMTSGSVEERCGLRRTSLSDWAKTNDLSAIERWTTSLRGVDFRSADALIQSSRRCARTIRVWLQSVMLASQFGESSRLLLSVGQTFVIIAAGSPFRRHGFRLRLDLRPLGYAPHSGSAGGTTARRRACGRRFGRLIVQLARRSPLGLINGVLRSPRRASRPLIVRLSPSAWLGFVTSILTNARHPAVPDILVDAIGSGTIAGAPRLGVMRSPSPSSAPSSSSHSPSRASCSPSAHRQGGPRGGREIRSAQASSSIYVLSGTLAGLRRMIFDRALRDDHYGGHAWTTFDDLRCRACVQPVSLPGGGGIRQHRWNRVLVFIPSRASEWFCHPSGIPPSGRPWLPARFSSSLLDRSSSNEGLENAAEAAIKRRCPYENYSWRRRCFRAHLAASSAAEAL